ncbi:MAG: FAD-dependent oxidoreductase [Proteobacteria bacterium]|nr:FAD-dependent oxidoreductase [Pseudomonadota bacterium]
MMEVDVAIVGAGAAGLAAAVALRAAGQSTILLEAAATPGGRARTTTPAALGGAWLDEGAAWLHMAEHNPLVPMAQAAGQPLRAAFRSESLMFLGDRPATAAEHAEYDAADTAWTGIVMGRPAEPDTDLATAIGPFRHENPWAPTIEAWHASLIDAVDAPYLSLADFRLNQLDGQNLMGERGFGRLLRDLLEADAGPIRGLCPVSRIAWGGDRVRVETPQGAISAASVIVTVSTGVLGAGAIAFDPPLPSATEAAIADLPMGLLSKIVLRAAGEDRLGMTTPTHAFRRLERLGDPFLSFIAWPRGTDHVIGFVGGDAAWAVAPDPRAALDLARREWRAMFGARADAMFRPEGFTTDWGTDPHHLGAYSYARPGGAGARSALAAPIAEGRLLFAGEACRTDGMAGTVGGAVLDGRRAAALVIARKDPSHH